MRCVLVGGLVGVGGSHGAGGVLRSSYSTKHVVLSQKLLENRRVVMSTPQKGRLLCTTTHSRRVCPTQGRVSPSYAQKIA